MKGICSLFIRLTSLLDYCIWSLYIKVSARVHLWSEHVEISLSDGKRTLMRLGDQHHVCTYCAGSILSSERSRDLTVTASKTLRRKEPVTHWQEDGLHSCSYRHESAWLCRSSEGSDKARIFCLRVCSPFLDTCQPQLTRTSGR